MSESDIGTLDQQVPESPTLNASRLHSTETYTTRFPQWSASLDRPEFCSRQVMAKRLMDVTVSCFGLAVLSPFLLLVMGLIRLESRGPAIFRQRRVGRDGKEFEILKLRTMVDGAEDRLDHLKARNIYADDRLFKLERDPRVTTLGKLLRRTSIDELPQLLNVLRGEMSLVGPRPPLPSEVDMYADEHYERLLVLPGITGPWQVAGRNKITEFEEVIRLEREYIRNWSFGADFRILLRTIPAVLFMRGAH